MEENDAERGVFIAFLRQVLRFILRENCNLSRYIEWEMKVLYLLYLWR